MLCLSSFAGAALGNLTIVGFSSMCREVAAFSGYVPIYVYDKTKPKYGKTIGYLAQQVTSHSPSPPLYSQQSGILQIQQKRRGDTLRPRS